MSDTYSACGGAEGRERIEESMRRARIVNRMEHIRELLEETDDADEKELLQQEYRLLSGTLRATQGKPEGQL